MSENIKVNYLSEWVIGCAIELQRILGPGWLESTCQHCPERELELAGIHFKAQPESSNSFS